MNFLKFLLITLSFVFFIANLSQAGDNKSQLCQTGSDNEAKIEQVGTNNNATITIFGNANGTSNEPVHILQNGGDYAVIEQGTSGLHVNGNLAKIIQDGAGVDNHALIKQKNGSYNEAIIHSTGNKNGTDERPIEIFQLNGDQNYANLEIIGQKNRAKIEQNGKKNDATLFQQGELNGKHEEDEKVIDPVSGLTHIMVDYGAFIFQEGTRNRAKEIQIGDRNYSYINQNGKYNYNTIQQNGEDHRAAVSQDGDNLEHTLIQNGKGCIYIIKQEANTPVIHVIQNNP